MSRQKMMTGAMFRSELTGTGNVFGRKSGIRVDVSGDGAYTDGKVINVPAFDDRKQVPVDTQRVIRGFLDHEAGHLRHTQMDVSRQLREGCAKVQNSFLPSLVNALEDVRLERKVMQEYPGAVKNLRAASTQVNEHLKTDLASGDVPAEALSDIVQAGPIACTWEGRRNYGGPSNAELFDKLSEDVQAKSRDAVARLDQCETTYDVIKLAYALCNEWEIEAEMPPMPPPPPDQPSGGGDDGDDDGDQEGQRQGQGQQEGEGQGAQGGLGGGDKDDDQEGGKSQSNTIVLRDGERLERSPLEHMDMDRCIERVIRDGDLAPKRSMRQQITKRFDMEMHRTTTMADMPDYDLMEGYRDPKTGSMTPGIKPFTQRWNPEHAKRRRAPVYGIPDKLRLGTAADYANITGSMSGQVNVMRSKLRRILMSMDRKDWNRNREQGMLDNKRFAAALAGRSDIYKTPGNRPEINTAVYMLVDHSGSMSGVKIQTASQCAIALAEALNGTGVSFEVGGFINRERLDSHLGKVLTGNEHNTNYCAEYGRDEVSTLICYKKFDEPMREAKGPMSMMSEMSGGYNADADFVRMVLPKLLAREEERKILMVLSDGQPCGGGGCQLQESILKDAIKEVEDAGVLVIGIGIMDEAVRDYYKTVSVVNSVEDLSGEALSHIGRALLGRRAAALKA